MKQKAIACLRNMFAGCVTSPLNGNSMSPEEVSQEQTEWPTDLGLCFFQWKGPKLAVSPAFHTPEPGHSLRQHLRHILSFCSTPGESTKKKKKKLGNRFSSFGPRQLHPENHCWISQIAWVGSNYPSPFLWSASHIVWRSVTLNALESTELDGSVPAWGLLNRLEL